MNQAEFASGLAKNIARVREYVLCGDGSGGRCDCIGLIIGAIRLAGGKWAGTHGSNYAARNEMRELEYVTSASQLNLYDIVYKSHSPGDIGYDLPAKYKSGKDLNDYYHVGVATSVDPLVITHCTGVEGGIKRDITLGEWRYRGTLLKVENTKPIPVPTGNQALVNAKAVAMRKEPSVDAKILIRVPSGDIVDLPDPPPSEWTYVQYKGKEGWMMTKFLDKGGDTNA